MKSNVGLTRRVTFSSGHRYWMTAKSEAENRQIFGPWASPFNHGHNYVLTVSVSGETDPVTGMVVNIKDIDEVLQRTIVAQFEQKSINDEIPWFANNSSSTENILGYIVRELTGKFDKGVQMDRLKLEETPLLYCEYEVNSSMTTLTRIYEFAASHRLHVPTFSQAKNEEMFGKCNNAAGHGHNYLLEVTVTGTVDPVTGMIADIGAIDSTVEELVVDRYDHRNFNVDLPEFANAVPTSEVIAQEIFKRLDGKLPVKLARIRLHETARSYFEVSA